MENQDIRTIPRKHAVLEEWDIRQITGNKKFWKSGSCEWNDQEIREKQVYQKKHGQQAILKTNETLEHIGKKVSSGKAETSERTELSIALHIPNIPNGTSPDKFGFDMFVDVAFIWLLILP